MSKGKLTETVNWEALRKSAGLTLSELSAMTGFGVATINGLERRGEGSKRLKEKLLSVLLAPSSEDGESTTAYWRERALSAERKLDSLKSGLLAWLEKF